MASTLTVDNIVGATSSDKIHIPGHVVQIVEGVEPSSQFNTTSTSAVDATDFTVSITPSSATSKIFVLYTGRLDNYNNTSVNNRGYVYLVRGSTTIATRFVGIYHGDGSPNNRNNYNAISISKLDSPATTSAITYKIQLQSAVSSNTMSLSTGGYSNFVLMEIAQ